VVYIGQSLVKISRIDNHVKTTTRYELVNLSEPPAHLLSGGFETMAAQWSEVIQPVTFWTLYYYYHSNAVTINLHTYPVEPGDIAIFPPSARVVHAVVDGNTRFDYLMFDMPGRGPDRAVIPHVLQGMQARHQDWQKCGHRMMDTLLPLRAFAWSFMATNSLNIAELRKEVMLYDAEAWIQKHLSRQFTIVEMCQELHVSQRNLLRAFRAEHGVTPQEFIIQRRVREAARLLKTTDMQPKLVADAVGLPNLQHFNKVMRLRTGVSPRAFRSAREALRE